MTQFAGVHVATTTPFDPDTLEVDLERYRSHCEWLLGEGIAGLFPTGSLGEYESLSPDDRRAVVETAAEVAAGQALLVPGVSAPSSLVACELAEHARKIGADGVMLLPPTNHAATLDELVDHFSAVASVGLPVVVYNNPFSTRTDLTPDILARLATIDGVVAVKEFSGDVRRVSEILELAPDLEVVCGADDLALESAAMGAVGWIGGFTGVFPRETVELFELGVQGRVRDALAAYRRMLPALRWDTTPSFVQAIKLAIDLVERPGGGPPRPPRRRLEGEAAAQVEAAVAAVCEASR